MRKCGKGNKKNSSVIYILIALCFGILGALCLPQGLLIGILALMVIVVSVICCL